ncbi:mechanosensitive ion channel family protein [Erythrobacter sp. YT30]|uniref:mechanosensitive ion channel family protein n=1 Tax=Erythrobacter sp. YT30 TaxID=1735012 RepID=UPI00076BFF75|nr:mechanosensitive ion channel domain-containing protein [Erythrobacter sp. YT30]KWV90424.1 mechanosensitive ion channel protein [Erythrobacter sp. YT30]
MTATTPNSATEVTDPTTDETSTPADGSEQSDTATDPEGAQEPEAPAEETQPTPEEPVEVVEGSNNLIEGAEAQSETAGALLRYLHEAAFEIGNFRFSLLDGLLIIGVILLVVTVAWFVTRLSRTAIRKISRFDGSQKVLAEKLSTIAIWGIAFFIGMDMLGIDLTALAFAGGAFGLAIGFGLQKTFGNLISGIILLLDKSIKPGDVISVTDQAGNEAVGQIRKIGIRAISVITRDQTEHLIPNENLMINQVVNWSYSSKDVRVKAPVGVSYDSDLELVTKLLYQAVDDTPRVLKVPKPRVNVMEFGDNSVNFDVRFWIEDPEGGLANIRSDVYMRIWKLFKENDVEIPFPQRDLHLRSSKQLDQLVELISAGKA